MAENASLGLANENGSKVCQVCGHYFSPDNEEVVCHQCRKTKKTYQTNAFGEPQEFNAIGIVVGIIFTLIFLIGIGLL
jgi:hypothetical protein